MNEIGPWFYKLEGVMESFRKQFGELAAFHQLVEPAAQRAYDVAVEDASSELDPSENDWGDVYYAAEQTLGTGLHEIAEHLGLMVLIRAVALAEVSIARMAARFFSDAENVVFTDGKAWDRRTANSFYRTMLTSPFDLDSLGMGTIVQLRNVYVHGYGEFPNSTTAEYLESQLAEVIDFGPASEEELALGFADERYVLGPNSRRRDGTRRLTQSPGPVAHLSSLVTHRLLAIVSQTVETAFSAAQWGLKEGDDIARSRFARDWMKRQGETGVGEIQLDFEGEVEIRFYGKQVLLRHPGFEGETEALVARMRDGVYQAKISLASLTGTSVD